jgi:putative ABC transport system permease protein
MKFPLYLAIRNLLRHPGRNLLYILGISITAALLLDMILLSSGLSISLEKVLKQMGYEVRLSPRGTLPFETDAQITQYNELKKQLQSIPSVAYVDAMLGTSLAVQKDNENFSSFVLGLQLRTPVFYRVQSGRDFRPDAREVLVNKYLADARKIKPGDHLKLWPPGRSQTTGAADTIDVVVTGVAFFDLDAEGQFTVAGNLRLVQKILGQQNDPVSVVMLKLKDSAQAGATADVINSNHPRVSAYTIQTVLEAVDKQLSYFKQFSYILGGISLVVTFVLVFIITTISFHDRLGEIALLRAIGLGNKTIFSTIVLEGVLTALAAAVFGFMLGKVVAIYLDRILTSAPGLPEEFSFFVMQPGPMLRGALTLLLTGFFAGLYPASTAVTLPVSDTLREEIL